MRSPRPPSTYSVCTVMKLASSETGNSTAFAMSSGLPVRLSAARLFLNAMCSSTSFGLRDDPVIGVSTKPGEAQMLIHFRLERGFYDGFGQLLEHAVFTN